MSYVSKNKVVSIHYTLKSGGGEVLDSSEGRDPLVYIQGAQNIIAGLENALENKVVGDALSVVIEPVDAYGERREDLVQSVSLDQFDNQEAVQPGAQFQMQSPEGVMIATVVEVDAQDVTIDLNHPLAGMALHFDVEVVAIREATEDELSHGHVHGAGGCH